jgi:hypothetical protein
MRGTDDDGLKFEDVLKQQRKESENNRKSIIKQELKRLSKGDILENGRNNMNILIRISERLCSYRNTKYGT